MNWNETPTKSINERQEFAKRLGKILPEREEIVDNHIEEKLNDLLEETRRKLYKHENTGEIGLSEDSSPFETEGDHEGGFAGAGDK